MIFWDKDLIKLIKMAKGNYGPGPCIIIGLPFILIIWGVHTLQDKLRERKKKNMQITPS